MSIELVPLVCQTSLIDTYKIIAFLLQLFLRPNKQKQQLLTYMLPQTIQRNSPHFVCFFFAFSVYSTTIVNQESCCCSCCGFIHMFFIYFLLLLLLLLSSTVSYLYKIRVIGSDVLRFLLNESTYYTTTNQTTTTIIIFFRFILQKEESEIVLFLFYFLHKNLLFYLRQSFIWLWYWWGSSKLSKSGTNT